MIPHVYKGDEELEKTQLKGTLMTMDKFKREFPEENKKVNGSSWEGAEYVEKISELAKQKTRERFNPKKEKRIGVVKKSFIGDRQHVEVPEYYDTV